MNQFYKRVFGVLAIGCIISSAIAQNTPAKKMVIDQNGHPNLVQFEKSAQKYAAHEARSVFKEQLNLKAEESYVKKQMFEDQEGMVHQKYQQTYKGFNVEYGTYTIHAKDGEVLALSGEYKEVNAVEISQSISETQALNKALDFVGAEKYMWESKGNEKWLQAELNQQSATWFPNGKLVICQNFLASTKEDKMAPRLAYKFNIYAQKPISRAFIYVDANTGEIINHNAIIKTAVATATADTRYSGSKSIKTDSYNGSYRLRDVSRGNGIETYDMNTGTNYNSAVDFTDSNNNWTAAEFHNAAKDDAAIDAHWGAQMTYDYFKTMFNRNSFDNNGATIKSYVHYDNAYDNAYWDGQRMTYGDGSDTYFDALTSLDVAAHEIGHAVCSYTANLAYQNESGAMNEAFSDIWAACVEYYAAPEKSTWLLGEDIDRRSGHVALRSMSDPKAENQPDTYFGTNWAALSSSPSQGNDYGGVHTNSGVLNFWFYLVSIGKNSTNDNGDAYTVAGIGIDKAAQIAYRMETVYLSANSTFANARTYAIQSAEELFGAGSNEVIQTTNAMYAVGVGDAYGGGTTPSYCASKGNDFSYEWISKVVIGNFTKSSASAGYSNFTTDVVELAPGQAYSISLTPSFKSTTYDEYWKIWIDYNGDKDFADAGELVFDAGSMSKTVVTGTINIPSSANGQTRMRVSMKYNAAQTECEAFAYGEVEDYTVEFTTGTPDTLAPTAPTGLLSSNITQTTVDLNWTASTDNVGVKEYIVYKDGNQVGITTNTSAQITGLTASTTYSFYVKATDDAGNVSTQSSAKSVTTADPVVENYCTTKGSDSSYEWIDLVEIGGVSNTTGNDGGYADYTAQVANVNIGANTIYFSAGFRSSSYTEYWHVWIDINHDGIFSSDEQFANGSSTSADKLSSDFTIPSTALLGNTRMRVTMKYNSAGTACETFSYGEVEDYTVNIVSAPINFATVGVEGQTLGNENTVDFKFYPNPVNSELNFNFANDRTVDVTIYDLTGKVVYVNQVSGRENQLDVSELKSGVYAIVLSDGQKNITQKLVKE